MIEAAIDDLRQIPADKQAIEAKELHEALGDMATPSFTDGYLLGIQTARVFLRGSVALAQAGVKSEDLL